MPMTQAELITCANCQARSEHRVLIVTSCFGWADLDNRPPEPHRRTIGNWVQQCPSCSYCAVDLSKRTGDLTLIGSPMYTRALTNDRLPDLARRFLAQGVLLEPVEPIGGAAVRLQAAWVCDDERAGAQPHGARRKTRSDPASECRLEFIAAVDRAQPIAGESGRILSVARIDALRRTSQFQAAAAGCPVMLALPDLDQDSRLRLELEAKLISQRDIAAHSVEECEGSHERRREHELQARQELEASREAQRANQAPVQTGNRQTGEPPRSGTSQQGRDEQEFLEAIARRQAGEPEIGGWNQPSSQAANHRNRSKATPGATSRQAQADEYDQRPEWELRQIFETND